MNPITRRVETALAAIAAGKFIVLADSADRENDGNLENPLNLRTKQDKPGHLLDPPASERKELAA